MLGKALAVSDWGEKKTEPQVLNPLNLTADWRGPYNNRG